MPKTSAEKPAPKPGTRAARLAAELRANLLKRKAQARSRRFGGGEEVGDAGQPAPSPDGDDEPATRLPFADED